MKRFLLVGIDAEGDRRESWSNDRQRLRAIGAASMAVKPELGPPWQTWELWGNARDGSWKCLNSQYR